MSKRTAPETLIEAIRIVAAGGMYIEAAIAQHMAAQDLSGTHSPIEQLSEREFQVFVQLAHDISVNRIAQMLHLSPSTVGSRLYNIRQKLGVTNQAELTLIAVQNGLIQV